MPMSRSKGSKVGGAFHFRQQAVIAVVCTIIFTLSLDNGIQKEGEKGRSGFLTGLGRS